MTWRLAPSLVDLRAQLNAMAPRRSKAADGTVGDLAHAARSSRHNPNAQGIVCALDVTHDPAGGMDCRWLREALRVAKDPRTGVVISMGQIFSSTATSARPAWTWGRYTGPNPHNHHLHVDVHSGGTRAGFWNLSRDLGSAVRPPTRPAERPTVPEDDMTPAQEAQLARADENAYQARLYLGTLASKLDGITAVLPELRENAREARRLGAVLLGASAPAPGETVPSVADPDAVAARLREVFGDDLAAQVAERLTVTTKQF